MVALVVGVEQKDVGPARGLVRGSSLLLSGCLFALGLTRPFLFGFGVGFPNFSNLALVSDIPFIEQNAEFLDLLRLRGRQICRFTGILFEIIELSFATLRRVFHFAGLTVVGQQQLVVALDDPAVEEGRLGILDIGNVVGERFSVERVAFDCVAAPSSGSRLRPGKS